MNTPSNAVVVAVSADGADAALSFAVSEARRTQRPLHLVHVLPIKAGEAYVGVYGGMLDTAKAILDGGPDEGRGARRRRRTRHRRADRQRLGRRRPGPAPEGRLGPGAPAPGEEQGATRLHRVDRPECRRSLPGAGRLRAGGLGRPASAATPS